MAYGLLKGKKGLIFGALNEHSIAWKTAEKAYEEGATFLLTNTPSAMRMGTIQLLAEKCKTQVIAADATKTEDIAKLLQHAMNILGGKLDFILHSVAMSANMRRGREYDNLDYEYFKTTLDISALSFHKLLQVAKQMDAINEWGSVVALSFIAAQRTMHGYNDMAEAKALLESIARSFGYIYGTHMKVRINTISQSPTVTTAGSGIKGMESLLDYTERMSPLGNASAADCADFCVLLFSDMTRKITMQNIFHDGGFSSMGMSYAVMKKYDEGHA